MTIENIIIQLTSYVSHVPAQVMEIDAEELMRRPAPGKWSKKEIMGHLVDSAINNVKRFTESQIQSAPYKMIPYRQAELVEVNRYYALPTEHILFLWITLNQQIIYVLSGTPASKLSESLITASGETVTFEYWAFDYLEHLEHHLRQVIGELSSPIAL